VQHFHHLSAQDRSRLFSHQPQPFARHGDKDVLAVALGATLYMPATRPALVEDLVRQGERGVMSSVVCLEDAVADRDLVAAEANVVAQLGRAACVEGLDDRLPLTFVRVRHPDQVPLIVAGLGDHAEVLSGFVLPKFTAATGPAYLAAIRRARVTTGVPLLAMPVVESPEVIHRESRLPTLLALAELLEEHRDLVLAVRLGATDLSAAYGVRRGRDLTIWDVRLVCEAITDVVNVLGRADGTGHVVTGPVWEYFAGSDRLFKPQLRETPFAEHHAPALRQELLVRDLDGLIREVVLDKANGLTGKTVIHPTHVAAVHALSVVTHEEYADACDILGDGLVEGGVRASSYRNKMNEGRPHRSWAERTLRRAAVFGVAAEDVGFVELLAAGIDIP
jgi:citrate lyase beta subunit